MPHFFYLCYSLKPTARGEWLGYISEGWRDFLEGIDPKPKAVWRERFFGVNLRRLERLFAQYRSKAEGRLAGIFFRGTFPDVGDTFCRGLTKSRRQSGAVLFRVIAAGRLGSLAIGVERLPEVVWLERLFRAQFRRLVGLFAGYRPKAEGCLELYFFGLSQRATWGASRSVGKGSRRLSGRNVFSGYISGRWRDFLQRIDQKPKAVWREYFFGVHFQRLEWLFAEDLPKAGGSLA